MPAAGSSSRINNSANPVHDHRLSDMESGDLMRKTRIVPAKEDRSNPLQLLCSLPPVGAKVVGLTKIHPGSASRPRSLHPNRFVAIVREIVRATAILDRQRIVGAKVPRTRTCHEVVEVVLGLEERLVFRL